MNMTTVAATKTHINPRRIVIETLRRNIFPRSSIHHQEDHVRASWLFDDRLRPELPYEPHRTASLRSHTAQYSAKNVAHNTMMAE